MTRIPGGGCAGHGVKPSVSTMITIGRGSHRRRGGDALAHVGAAAAGEIDLLRAADAAHGLHGRVDREHADLSLAQPRLVSTASISASARASSRSCIEPEVSQTIATREPGDAASAARPRGTGARGATGAGSCSRPCRDGRDGAADLGGEHASPIDPRGHDRLGPAQPAAGDAAGLAGVRAMDLGCHLEPQQSVPAGDR